MQFARDAHLAEGWVMAQETTLKTENLGVSTIRHGYMVLQLSLSVIQLEYK